MTRDYWTDAGEILVREYIKFYCQYKDYDRKEKQELHVLRESAYLAGTEANSAVVNITITQERRATYTRGSVLLNDVLSDIDEERMNDDG